MTETNDDFELIHSYSRQQAIEDGILIAIESPISQMAGFKFPVAMTAAAFEKCVRVPEGVVDQDEMGRLWGILAVFRHAAGSTKEDSDRITFQLYVRNDDSERNPPLVRLKAVCGPNDDGSPCITIMLPEED